MKAAITAKEAARHFGISPNTVYLAAAKGKLGEPVFLASGRSYYDMDQVEAWAEDFKAGRK